MAGLRKNLEAMEEVQEEENLGFSTQTEPGNGVPWILFFRNLIPGTLKRSASRGKRLLAIASPSLHAPRRRGAAGFSCARPNFG